MEIKDARKYQTMPDMPPHQFEALKADIEERGILTPIDLDENGNILDGHHRFRACKELGITDFPTIIRPGLTEEEKRLYSRKTNMMRRHLGAKQIRELIRAQLKETPQWANNRIGKELGVDSKTVKKQREALEATLEIPKLTELEGADGKTRKERRGGIFATSDKDRARLLDHLAKHGIKNIEEFITAETAITIQDSNYNIWAGLTEEEENEWHVFIHFLWKRQRHGVKGAFAHVEWLRNKDFKTPDEWLGPEGVSWSRRIFMNKMTDEQAAKIREGFAEYLEKNRGRVEELKAEMEERAKHEDDKGRLFG